jgi:hypothetical protein
MRALALSALLLLGSASAVAADCAWVLYWSPELGLLDAPGRPPRRQEPLSAYGTKAECEAAATLHASNIHRNWTGGFSVFSPDGEKITATMKCLPDTVKP